MLMKMLSNDFFQNIKLSMLFMHFKLLLKVLNHIFVISLTYLGVNGSDRVPEVVGVRWYNI